MRLSIAPAAFLWSALAFSSLQAMAKETPESTGPDIDEKYRSLETLARGLFFLESLYVDPEKVSQDKLVNNALNGIVAQLDPHTMVMPSKAFEQLTIDTQGKFGGVGIIVSSERGKLIVVSPIEDTPAYRAGVKSGDEIIAIDGHAVKEMKESVASEKMRGKPDTKLRLTVKRKDVKDLLHFDLMREIIKVKSVRTQEFSPGVLYARIASFQDNTADELGAALKAKQGKIKGMILDLRDNPGGLLDQAVRVADFFVESGVIVSTVGRKKEDVEREFAHKRGTFAGFPMIILINGGSASASEIVAGALQDHERGIIMGTTSFGKGSVQTLISLPNRSGLKITVARYYTPKDRSIQAKGIQPDIVVGFKPITDLEGEQRKESDLKGHIESKDLSDLASTPSSVINEVKKWPEAYRQDNQIITAYTYLRGWGMFHKDGPQPGKGNNDEEEDKTGLFDVLENDQKDAKR